MILLVIYHHMERKIEMINLKEQAVKGATVYFRCGGKAVIRDTQLRGSHSPNGFIPKYIRLEFEEALIQYRYRLDLNGMITEPEEDEDECEALLDIISIEPPVFDWSTVKAGMCFTDKNGRNYWFMCQNWNEAYIIWVSETKDCCSVDWLYKKDLIRAPEHDIEVKA